ncbi:MAG: hypothetical protein Q9P14_18505 [candidate division KSB1 bacterium]|nr:hypothetical protein [candidate division KSB1 bacterium]
MPGWLAGKPESVPIDTIDEKTVARKINHFIANLDLINQWLASRTRVKAIEKEIDSREKETAEVEK